MFAGVGILRRGRDGEDVGEGAPVGIWARGRLQSMAARHRRRSLASAGLEDDGGDGSELQGGGGVRVVRGRLAPMALELVRVHGELWARVAECLVASGGGEVVGVVR